MHNYHRKLNISDVILNIEKSYIQNSKWQDLSVTILKSLVQSKNLKLKRYWFSFFFFETCINFAPVVLLSQQIHTIFIMNIYIHTHWYCVLQCFPYKIKFWWNKNAYKYTIKAYNRLCGICVNIFMPNWCNSIHQTKPNKFWG